MSYPHIGKAMQTVKFIYAGSNTRKLTVMGRDQVIVSGDDNSTQFVFKFPDAYNNYSKEIVWSGFYIESSDGTTQLPRQPLVNDSCYVPEWVTQANAGSEISFQLVLFKPQDESIPGSFDITETSLEFPVYISKSARSEQVVARTDTVSELLQKAFVRVAYDINEEQDRPVLTLYNTLDNQEVVILDVPYLQNDGTIQPQFLPTGSKVRLYKVANVAEMEALSAEPPDFAFIEEGTQGSEVDYPGNIFIKTNYTTDYDGWYLIFSQYTVDQVPTIEQDIDSLQGRADADEQAIDALDTRLTAQEGDITALDTRMDSQEGDISQLDNRLDTAETKLATIESGAEVNVQQNWTETNSASDQYIQNKPTLGTAQALDQTTSSQGSQDAGKVVQLDNTGTLDTSVLPTYVQSVNTRSGAVTLTKSDVGLTNTDDGAKAPVDNLTSTTNPPLASTVQTQLNGKVDQNSAITGATKAKITYDSKGLVTQGQDLVQSDIPNLPASKITSGQLDMQVMPSNMGVIYSGTITGDGTTSQWTYPIQPYGSNVSQVSIRDSNGYEVRFGVQYGTGNITLYQSEPPSSGEVFNIKLIVPTQ